MQSKLSGSQKDNHHEMRKGGCWFWLKRTRGSHRTRSKRKEFFVFTLLAIMFFTALIWSYEPHLASLSSRQEQFGLRNPATSYRVTVKQEDVLLREPHLIRAQMEERSKPLTANVENTNHGTEKTPEDSSTREDDKEGNDPSSPFRKKETAEKFNRIMENVQNTKLVVEESFTSKGSSLTQGSSQYSATDQGLSATNSSYDSEGSLDREKEEKDSSSFAFKKQEIVDKPKPLAENVQNTKLVVKEPFISKGSSTTRGSTQSSTTTERLSANISPNDIEDSLAKEKEDKGSSLPMYKKKDIEDKSKPITENVPNTKLVVEETFTSKGSSTARGFSQSSATTEGLSTNKGFDSTEEKKDKDSTSLTNKNEVDRPQPVTENVQNTTPVVEGSSTSKQSSKTQSSTQSFATTEGLFATKGANGIEASLAKEKEDKNSSSSMSQRKEDVAKSEEGLVQEPVLVEDKEEKGMPKSQLKDVEIKKAFVNESFALNNSSTNKDVLRTEKEDKVTTSPYQKKVNRPEPGTKNIQSTRPVVEESSISKESFKTRSSSQSSARTEGLFATKGSDATEASLTREKEGKDSSSSTSQRKAQISKDVTKTDDESVQEPLVTHKEAEDKQKIQLDTIEYKKPVANESSEMPYTSTDPSPTEESLQREQKNKVSASANENKEISKDMAISKDGPSLKEHLHIRKEMEDKAKAQLDDVQSGKPVANESLAINESSVTQDKSLTEESTAANGSSNTSGIIRRKKQDKVLSSTSENKECNYAKGRWVFDSRRPLYSGFKCKRWLPWIFACRLTTRPDFSFEQFRWQPENCDMPEFERHSFLERMMNKTIAFVGDSIGRQQFQSFMCMLTGGEDTPEVEDVGPEYGIRPKNMAYRFPQTNTTIIYFWSSCLCDLTPMNTSNPDAGVAMHLDRPPAFLRENLHKFDVLVLNTGHHWNRGKIKVNKWVMHVDGKPNMDKTLFTVASAKNFTIWSIAKWVDSQLKSHPRGLKAFFRTISPRHFFGGEWNTGGSCENTTPLVHGSQVTQNESSDELVASAVKGTGVRLLDITALSALRDEGHISKYGHKANSGVRDCLHWCLPGIPDTWNEILAAQI